MARARAVVGGLLLVLIAAPAYAAPPSHSYGLGELLGPVVAPLKPVTESVGDLLTPITEPVGDLLAPITEPVGDLLAPITEPVGEILEPVTDPLLEVLAPVTDPLLEPIEDVLAPVTDPLLEPIEVIDPITNPVEEVTAPITDPILDPVEEVLDPSIDPVEDVIDPPLEPNLPPVGGGNIPGGPAIPLFGTSVTGVSEPSVGVAGSLVGSVPSSTAELVSSAVSLLPPPSTGVLLTPSLPESVLSQILDWLSDVNFGSFFTAPFLGLQVLLRALASAGRGLLVPGVMLAMFAFLMARDRRIRGTKTA